MASPLRCSTQITTIDPTARASAGAPRTASARDRLDQRRRRRPATAVATRDEVIDTTILPPQGVRGSSSQRQPLAVVASRSLSTLPSHVAAVQPAGGRAMQQGTRILLAGFLAFAVSWPHRATAAGAPTSLKDRM